MAHLPTSDRRWSVVDNLRKGAATNAIQIAETLIARDAVKPRQAAFA